MPNSKRKDKEKEKRADSDSAKNETDASSCQNRTGKTPYYLSVKDELDRVFSGFSHELGLEKMFPDSVFVKVPYSKEKFYVVGLVKELGVEKYICYGVPEKYSPNPPEALKDCATFIPLSIFDLKGDGYWMMFQDAITGDCIKLKKTNKAPLC